MSTFEITQDKIRVLGEFKHADRIQITKINVFPPNPAELATPVYQFDTEQPLARAATAA